jgi:hypothetical protein
LLVLLFLVLRTAGASAPRLPGSAGRGTRSRNNAASAFFPDFRGWKAGPPTMLPAAPSAGGRFWFPVQTKAADGGTKPGRSGSCSVSSAPPRIAFQRVKGARRTFSARAPPVLLASETFIAKAQLHSSGLPTHVQTQRGEPTAYRQARLNSRNPTNIAIPFTHRQWQLAASDGNDGFIADLMEN